MTMRFEFTARVNSLSYDTNAQVEEQARKYVADPDMLIFALEIGTWTHAFVKGDEVIQWQANVVAHVDDGRPIGEPPEPGQAVVWND